MGMSRTHKGLFLVPVALLLSACAGIPVPSHVELPQQYRMPLAPLAATFERRSGRIAILDGNGNLVIMDQTGGNAVQMTTDANASTSSTNQQNGPATPLETTYQYPVWSPDASQIAFVEMTAVRSSSSRTIEIGADAVTVQRGDQSITIQQSQTGSTASRDPGTMSVERQPSRVIIERSTGGDVVASSIYLAPASGKAPLQELYNLKGGAVGFLDWSPDSSQLAFLTQVQSGQTDLDVLAKGTSKPRTVSTGVSASWSWRPDGKALLAKVDISMTDNTANLAVWDVQSGKLGTPIQQNVVLPFVTPSYSPDGNAMLLTVQSNGHTYLALADRQGAILRKLSPVAGHVSYVWSPSGAQVAYIDMTVSSDSANLLQGPTGGALHVLDVNSGADKILTQIPVTSFFWSPDGKRIAAFSPVQPSQMAPNFPGIDLTSNQPSSMYMLQTIDVNTRAARQLFYLEPTDEFARLLDQFDRFSQAGTIWSPDSGHLVLSIIDSNQQNSIIETEATGSIEPRVLSKGTLAVWSPR
jgi:Tol biopolymer transport system component